MHCTRAIPSAIFIGPKTWKPTVINMPRPSFMHLIVAFACFQPSGKQFNTNLTWPSVSWITVSSGQPSRAGIRVVALFHVSTGVRGSPITLEDQQVFQCTKAANAVSVFYSRLRQGNTLWHQVRLFEVAVFALRILAPIADLTEEFSFLRLDKYYNGVQSTVFNTRTV